MTRIFVPYDEVHDLLRNDWAMLTVDKAFLKAFPQEVPEAQETEERNAVKTDPLWTDHYNNLFSILKK